MPGTFEELDIYFKSEEEKKRSPKFRAESIRTFLRDFYSANRDKKQVEVHFLFEVFSLVNKECKESNFISITKKAYITFKNENGLMVDLSRQRVVRTRKSE